MHLKHSEGEGEEGGSEVPINGFIDDTIRPRLYNARMSEGHFV